MDRIEVMSSGICYRTLCVQKDVTVEEIDAFDPVSGTERGWQRSENPTFHSGETNPCKCDQDPDRMHYLQDC